MGKARGAWGWVFVTCTALGACSTESSVDRDYGSATVGDTGGSMTSDTAGQPTGQPSGMATNVAVGDAVDLDGDGTSDGLAVDADGDGVADGVDTNGDGLSDAPLPAAPTGGDDFGDDAGAPMDCVKGVTQGSSVLLIGDSYVDINGKAFGTELQRLARAEGSLGANDKYADRSLSGTQMVGGIYPIPNQYADERNSDGHIKTVVMDGGGNDILLGNRSCITQAAPPQSQSCVQTIDNAMAAARTLLAKMADDGVEEVVYFFYPHLPGGGLGGDKALENQTVDYAIPFVKETCESAPVHCTFVDTRGLFPDQPGEFQDGVHPTVDNIKKISAKVWQTMKAQCIAQ